MMYSGLEYLDEPRDLERLATPFGGGMGRGDACGFYCSALMLIGLACAGVEGGRASVRQAQGSFTKTWTQSWPLSCRDIKSGQKSGDVSLKCADIGREAGKLLAVHLEGLARNPKRARFARKS